MITPGPPRARHRRHGQVGPGGEGSQPGRGERHSGITTAATDYIKIPYNINENSTIHCIGVLVFVEQVVQPLQHH